MLQYNVMLSSILGYLVLLLVIIASFRMDYALRADYAVMIVLQVVYIFVAWILVQSIGLKCSKGCGVHWKPSLISRAMRYSLDPLLVGMNVCWFAVFPNKATAAAAPALLAIGFMIDHAETVFNPPHNASHGASHSTS